MSTIKIINKSDIDIATAYMACGEMIEANHYPRLSTFKAGEKKYPVYFKESRGDKIFTVGKSYAATT